MLANAPKAKMGRKRIVKGFRGWCRKVVEDPKVRAAMERAALESPEFALKIAEHGYGRPPQAKNL